MLLYCLRMQIYQPSRFSKRVHVLSSVLALLSIVFHIGLSAVHCHDLEEFEAKIGTEVQHFQLSGNDSAGDPDQAGCTICQLLSIFKGPPPQALSMPGAAFAGLTVLPVVRRTAFVALPGRMTGHPRAPPGLAA